MTAGSSDAASPPPPKASFVEGWGPYIAIAGCVWLGWQSVQALIAERGPPALAVGIAPRSAAALGRAAELELAAGRSDNARALALEALSITPFDTRSLRVVGLSTANAGDMARADEILTLAGNWSLRDTPSHGWLVAQRLRQGSYSSSFAHADTIARRREETHPRIFNLFTNAAAADPRSLPALAELLARRPNWRWAYMKNLAEAPKGDVVLASLAVLLKDGEGRLQAEELQLLFSRWMKERRIPAIVWLKSQLDPSGTHVEDGSFSSDSPMGPPFAWRLFPSTGASQDIVEDDLNDKNQALRVEVSREVDDPLAEQLLTLSSGRYTLKGRWRSETATKMLGFEWRLRCFEDSVELGSWRSPISDPVVEWTPFSTDFSVPAQGCTAQWLQLRTWSSERSLAIGWFDEIQVLPASGG